MPLNQFITLAAFAMGAAQLIFLANFIYSLFAGRRAGCNPWNSNTLEWQADSPPIHGNFDFQPIVTHGPYEYSHPQNVTDYWPQNEAK